MAKVRQENFGSDVFSRFSLKENVTQVEIISLGATITAFKTPDKFGNVSDVVLGFDNPEGYDGQSNPFFWGVTGRVTNRIKEGKVKIDDVTHTVSLNDFGTDFRHHVHGGFRSFDRKNWDSKIVENGVEFSLISPHMDEGINTDL